MPGVFTHGDFDTWSPGYLMFLAAMHNGVSRLYETFGNGGADTQKRILQPEDYSRTWYRQNPPLPVVTWSQRDNNNYEQSALLSTLSYYSHHTEHFLDNYYLKSKRSVQKPALGGPAAYVLPASAAEANRQIQLLRILRLQHVEISRLTQARTQAVPAAKRGGPPTTETVPAGSLVVRMDQPYSRIADALLDRQYWAPDDPQKHPYDDTGWSFSQLFNVKVLRVTDPAILAAPMEPMDDPTALSGVLRGSGPVVAINDSGQSSLLPLTFALRPARIAIAEAPFDAQGEHFAAGTLLISGADEGRLAAALKTVLPGRDAPGRHAPGRRPSGCGAADRLDAHLAQHPGGGVVAAGLRQGGRSLRLYQHPDRRGRCRPAGQIRRDRVRPGGPRLRAGHP